MANKTFRIVLDNNKYANFEGLGDVGGRVAQVQILKISKKIRDAMVEKIANESYETDYGYALDEMGIERVNYGYESSADGYESITRSLVVHAKKITGRNTGHLYTTIGARTRGAGSSVGAVGSRRSASVALAELDSGITYSGAYRFELFGGRESATDRPGGSNDGFWTTKGYEGKHFMSTGKSTTTKVFAGVSQRIAFMQNDVIEMFVKEKGYKKAGNYTTLHYKKEMDSGVDEE